MSTSKDAIDDPERYNLIYPWKFWTKHCFFQGSFFSAKLSYTHFKFQDQKRRLLETPHEFSLITILFFFNKPPVILHTYFFDIPRYSSNKPLMLFRIFYCDIHKLMYLQILFLNALFISIYQFLDSKTLSLMVLSVVGGSGGN